MSGDELTEEMIRSAVRKMREWQPETEYFHGLVAASMLPEFERMRREGRLREVSPGTFEVVEPMTDSWLGGKPVGAP